MDKKDFSNLEDQIMSTVNNALKAVDFANLKKDINDKTEGTINQFKTKLNGYTSKYMNLNKKNKNDVSNYISKKPAGSKSGVVYIVFGSIGICFFGSSALGFLIFKLLLGSIAVVGSNILFGTSLLLLAASVGLLVRGISLLKRVKRFKTYVRFINDNSYFLIQDLANFARERKRFVVKDLSKMIEVGMFLEGHIDEEKTYFMLSDEVYNDYLNLKKQQIIEVVEEIDDEKLEEEIYNSEIEEVEGTIKIGRNYIEQIKNIRNELYKEEIAVKLDKLGDISNQILSQVEKNPNKIQEVNKFINHYLPITIKLINSYRDLNNQSVQGENIENAKIEIEKSIDLINNAFENLLDDLFEDVVLDVSTDISVLKTLFKQEGLVEDDFKK